MIFNTLITKRAALSVSAIGATIIANAHLTQPKLHTEAATPIGWESIGREREPAVIRIRRKPIYDEPTPYQKQTPESAQPTLPPSTPSAIVSPETPVRTNTTDKLASHVRIARLFLHAHVAAAEDSVNRGLDRIFHLEHSFTSTIASLAPAPETAETLLPGSIYVLVAAMTGSIVTRNRGLLIRGAGPLAFGVTAGWVLLPHTMRNISDLVWKWEEKVPAVANNHLLVRGFLEQGAKEVSERGDRLCVWIEDIAREGRETVEGWIQKVN